MDKQDNKKKSGKPGMLKRLFSSRKLDVSGISLSENNTPTDDKKKPFHRSNTIDSASFKRPTAADLAAAGYTPHHRRQNSVSGSKMILERSVSDPKEKSGPRSTKGPLIKVEYANRKRDERISEADSETDSMIAEEERGRRPRSLRDKTPPSRDSSLKRKLRCKKTLTRNFSDAELTNPLEFPCTPELILEHHKRKELLNPTEEWLLLELNEFECLVDHLYVIKLMAKHSKFFEVEPPELVEEFFLFVEELPAYDEVLNNDIWLEFRDKKYLC